MDAGTLRNICLVIVAFFGPTFSSILDCTKQSDIFTTVAVNSAILGCSEKVNSNPIEREEALEACILSGYGAEETHFLTTEQIEKLDAGIKAKVPALLNGTFRTPEAYEICEQLRDITFVQDYEKIKNLTQVIENPACGFIISSENYFYKVVEEDRIVVRCEDDKFKTYACFTDDTSLPRQCAKNSDFIEYVNKNSLTCEEAMTRVTLAEVKDTLDGLKSIESRLPLLPSMAAVRSFNDSLLNLKQSVQSIATPSKNEEGALFLAKVSAAKEISDGQIDSTNFMYNLNSHLSDDMEPALQKAHRLAVRFNVPTPVITPCFGDSH